MFCLLCCWAILAAGALPCHCKGPQLGGMLDQLPALSPENCKGPVVDTPLGTVVGWERLSRDGRVYQAWTTIPYAQPPVGKLRFKAPKPALKWLGIFNATGDPPACLQPHPDGPMSEDCLFLNVYRPKNVMRKMPVIVHVHGGGFQQWKMPPRDSADYMMDEDVVLVQIQYRLNGIGFMGLGDKVMPGNFGLKDQVLALKWVQKNIAAFGGDANSVTVMGESSGGCGSHFLLKTPAAEGLLHRAQSDSGTINRFWSLLKLESVRNATLGVAKLLGCDINKSNRKILKCMQHVDGKALLSALGQVGYFFLPCIEPKDAEDAVVTEDISIRPVNKPWITSTTNGEYTVIYTQGRITPEVVSGFRKDLDGSLKAYIERFVPTADSCKVSLVKEYYYPVLEPRENFTNEVIQMIADNFGTYPALYNMEMHIGPKWYYLFEYVGEVSSINQYTLQHKDAHGAGHAEQMFYFFNYRSMYPTLLAPKENPEDYQVSKRMIKYLVNFAYYNDPTPPGSPVKWYQFRENEMLKVSNSQSDSMAEPSEVQPLLDVTKLWDNVVGWEWQT